MKKKVFLLALVVLAVAVSANAQSGYNRMNIEFSENYHFFHNPDFGKGNMMTVSAEWLPSFGKPNGTWGVIKNDLDRLNFGGYYSTTVRKGLDFGTWEDKRQTLDTGFNVSDFRLQTFGVCALINIGGFQSDLSVLIKTGPNFFNNNVMNKIKYNSYTYNYIDSVLSGIDSVSEVKNFSETQNNIGWDFCVKVIRFNRDALWAFQNSLEVKYSAVLKSEINHYKEGVLTGISRNWEGFFSIIGESNIGNVNLSDKLGVDQRVKLGFIKGAYSNFGLGSSSQIVIGASLCLVPRTDRKNDILTDALSVGYEWHSGSRLAGWQFYAKANLFSLGRLF